MKKLATLLGLLAVSGVAIAAALSPSASAETRVPPDREVVAAPIESVEVIASGAAPTGHALKVVAGLPNGCAEPFGSGVYRDGDVFFAHVTNTMPADDNTPCTMVYGTYEVVIDLGTDFVPDREYTAYINGIEVRFIAHGGIIPPDRVSVLAPIESVHIIATPSLPPQYGAQIVAGLPGSCSHPGGYEVRRDGTMIAIEVINFAPADPTVCAPVYTTYPLTVQLGSDFVSGVTYTVIVNGVSATFTAY